MVTFAQRHPVGSRVALSVVGVAALNLTALLPLVLLHNAPPFAFILNIGIILGQLVETAKTSPLLVVGFAAGALLGWLIARIRKANSGTELSWVIGDLASAIRTSFLGRATSWICRNAGLLLILSLLAYASSLVCPVLGDFANPLYGVASALLAIYMIKSFGIWGMVRPRSPACSSSR